MRSYEMARGLFSFLEFTAGLMVVAGVIIAIVGADAVSKYGSDIAMFWAAVPGLTIAFSGLISVAFIQAARAVVDTAEYTQQMLQVSRNQLDVSRQALKENATPKGFEAPKEKPAKETPKSAFAEGLSDSKSDTSDPQISDQSEKLEYTPIDAGNGVTQLNADATQLGYGGQVIHISDGVFSLDGNKFETLDAVQDYIDRTISSES